MSIATETQYEQLVRRGREAREQADSVQWVEGDLALQIDVLPPTERPRDPETGDFLADEVKALKRYAEDIGVELGALKNYRATAKAWPPEKRFSGVGFAIHKVLNAQDDRFDLIREGLTFREAQKIVRDRQPKANYSHEPGWHELLGYVGDSLLKAQKELDRFTEAVGDKDPGGTREKAELYAEWAGALATRLREVVEA